MGLSWTHITTSSRPDKCRVTCQVYRLFCPFKPFWFSSEKLVLQLWTLVLWHFHLFSSSRRSACRKPLHRGQGALNITSNLIDDYFEIIQLVFDLIFYLLFCNWQNPSNLCLTELLPSALKNCSKVWTKLSTMPFDRGCFGVCLTPFSFVNSQNSHVDCSICVEF